MKKKRNTDHDFPPHSMWAENEKLLFGRYHYIASIFVLKKRVHEGR